jgi:hypothetical protein
VSLFNVHEDMEYGQLPTPKPGRAILVESDHVLTIRPICMAPGAGAEVMFVGGGCLMVCESLEQIAEMYESARRRDRAK